MYFLLINRLKNKNNNNKLSKTVRQMNNQPIKANQIKIKKNLNKSNKFKINK